MHKKTLFWPKTTSILNNEEGMVIIAALMVLVLLTIIGIASTNVSNTEVKISTHELIYQQNFYRAEGATMEAVAKMESESPPFSWVTQNEEMTENLVNSGDLYNKDFWDNPSSYGYGTPGESALPHTHYFGGDGGLLPGEPLEIGSTKRHHFALYGRSAPEKRGEVIVEVGYIKAY